MGWLRMQEMGETVKKNAELGTYRLKGGSWSWAPRVLRWLVTWGHLLPPLPGLLVSAEGGECTRLLGLLLEQCLVYPTNE